MSVHRNPNAKPYTKPQTGSARRGNANANTQARNRLTNTLKTVSTAVSNTVKQAIISNTKSAIPFFVPKKTAGKKLGSNNRAFSGGYNYNYRSDKKSDFNPMRYGRVRGKMDEESRRFYDALTNKNSKYEIVKNKKTNKTYTIDK